MHQFGSSNLPRFSIADLGLSSLQQLLKPTPARSSLLPSIRLPAAHRGSPRPPIGSQQPTPALHGLHPALSSHLRLLSPRQWQTLPYSAAARLPTSGSTPIPLRIRDIAENGNIDRFSVIRLTQYSANAIQDRRIIIILDCDIVQRDVPDKLGNPLSTDDAIKSGSVGSGAGHGGGNGASAGARSTAGSSSAAPARRAGGGGGGGAGAHNGAPVYSIEGLSPYQDKCTIKARVTSKSDIKHYSNQRGEGKLFSVNFLDDTEIQECEDTEDVPGVKYAFVPLGQLETVEPNQNCDIIGVIESIGDLGTINCDIIGVIESIGDLGTIVSKASQREINKREITLVDQSGMSIRITLWGKQAQSFNENGDMEDKPVLAAKGVKVSDFGGRSLSLQSSSSMSINPDIPEAHGLRGWYDNQGAGQSFRAYTSASVGGSGAGGGAGAGANLAERRTIAQ
ncbi:unnamed protein product, partial [Tilletia controversa]